MKAENVIGIINAGGGIWSCKPGSVEFDISRADNCTQILRFTGSISGNVFELQHSTVGGFIYAPASGDPVLP
jgi:hypothetical protein